MEVLETELTKENLTEESSARKIELTEEDLVQQRVLKGARETRDQRGDWEDNRQDARDVKITRG